MQMHSAPTGPQHGRKEDGGKEGCVFLSQEMGWDGMAAGQVEEEEVLL